MFFRALSIAVLSLTFTSLAAGSNEDPGFDPAPVRVPAFVKTAPRPMNSMDLLTMRDLHGVTISPDGRFIAFVVGQAVLESNSYRTGLFVVNVAPVSKPVCLGTAGTPHWDNINEWDDSEAPQWSPDSRQIIYRTRMRPTDEWQVWRWNRTGGTPIQLTHAPGNVLSYRLIEGGSELLLAVEKPRDTSGDKEVYEHGILYDGSVGPYLGQSMVNEVLERTPRKIESWIHELASGRERKATAAESEAYGPWQSDLPPVTLPSQFVDSIVSPNGKMVAYRFFDADSTRVKKGSYELYAKPVRGGTPVLLDAPTHYIAEYWWSPDSSQVFFVENKGDGRSPSLMVAPATGGRATQVFQGTGHVTGFSPDRSGEHLACIVDSSTSPPEVAVLDLGRLQLTRVSELNPEFANLSLSSPVRLNGTNVDGDPWFAYLLKPLNYEPGKEYPLIVTGYAASDGFLRGASGDEYPIQVFAAHGFAVLDINFGRTQLNRPGNFAEALRIWQSPLDTLEAAIGRAAETGVIDRGKVGISGFSHGSEILEYAISHSHLFQAAIESGSAGRDPFFYYLGSNAWLTRFADWGLGGWPEGETRVKWKQLAPSLNADYISTPLLTNTADSEFLAGLALYRSLRELDKPAEIFVYLNELHVKNQPRHRYEIYNRNLDWFRFWLKDEEDPDPSKAEQYSRWRNLRDGSQQRKSAKVAGPNAQ
jgi:dipeptidyl aminopeptidase/acylaminoacyl peptidase